jgi:hypothetical protein
LNLSYGTNIDELRRLPIIRPINFVDEIVRDESLERKRSFGHSISINWNESERSGGRIGADMSALVRRDEGRAVFACRVKKCPRVWAQ